MTTSNTTQTFQTHSPDETRALAERLGRRLRAGDVLCLIGDLGAGKTTFTQGLALGLGLPADEPVNSPTFTLVAEHPGGRLPLYHFDVYRLPDSAGLYDLAFDEYIDGDGVTVIEWADKIADALPSDRLDIHLTAEGENERRLILTAHGIQAQTIMGQVSDPANEASCD
ncbi:MAG: tRNA (adenosine(37)-N6)-threonylcarbamoyltransferase complex ATPase subunit type 1 TsaE [Armatimonadota bacterium]|nr:tRNA (adenosine(37)-N6)-threonylcarbamoyltransferase complex ATPase subunit type 1 TsaE [Armatimonadota bacterium]